MLARATESPRGPPMENPVLIALSLAVQTIVSLPQITVRPRAGGFVLEAKPYDLTITSAVDAEIARRAEGQCAGKSVAWGKFESKNKLGRLPLKKAARVTRDRRAFTCVESREPISVVAPEGWTPSLADDADVRRLFETYYAKRDTGDILGARYMLSPETRSDLTEWGAQVRKFNQQLGRGRRRITAVSWEINPQAADRPGIFAAIDFVGDYPEAHFYCGYIGLYRFGPGKYQIVREEQNSAIRADGKMDASQLSQIRSAMCRD